MKVQKRAIRVEAIRLSNDKDDLKEILSWSTKKTPIVIVYSEEEVKYVEITTPEGKMTAQKGDWIVKGICGETYPVKDEIFIKTYDLIIENKI